MAEVIKPFNGPLKPNRHRTVRRYKVVTGLLLLVIIVLLILLSRKQPADFTFSQAIKKQQYQAVSLTNGQVYFGKLEKIIPEGYVLSDIYYLQVPNGQTAQSKPAKNQSFTLSKLGSEPHGPEDKMFIESRQVLLWENLKDNSQVVRAIKADQKK
jgi:hypothetical protein